MPKRARVHAFIEAVMTGDHALAIFDFYSDDASMQENRSEPRRGRELLIAHERNALARLSQILTHPPAFVVIDGNTVAISWMFDATDHKGVTRRLEEVAVQRWHEDRIVEERFFYDTASAWRELSGSERA